MIPAANDKGFLIYGTYPILDDYTILFLEFNDLSFAIFIYIFCNTISPEKEHLSLDL